MASRASELRPTTGTGVDGRIRVRVRGSPAKRRNGCQTTLGRSQKTGWVPGDDTALCTTAALRDVGSGGVTYTEHGLIVPQRRRIGPSTPPDPDAIDDC